MKNLNKMKIAGDMQFEIGQDKITHFPTWEVKDDKTLCQKVEDLKHSTFDLSKFEVVGTPTISEDGVVSNPNANFYEIRTINIGSLLNKSWSITNLWINNGITKRPSNATIVVQEGIIVIGAPPAYGIVENYGGDSIRFTGRFGDLDNNTGTTQITVISKTWAELGYTTTPNKFLAKLEFNYEAGEYKLYAKVAEEKDWKLVGTYIPTTSNKQLWNIFNYPNNFISASNNSVYNVIYNAIDLKNFSITVDGKEVFSGNKTGLDVIKADNYKIVGSLTISEDGVVTNFSNSSYIHTQNNFSIDISKNFEVHLKLKNIKYKPSLGDTGVFRFITGAGNMRFSLRYNGKNFYLVSGGDANQTETTGIHYFDYGSDTDVEIIYGLKDTTFYSKIKRSYDTDWYNLKTTTITIDDTFGSAYIEFGHGWANYMTTETGSIDLNAFKIYVDGNLVYQPCLKIPYTESKTGSKIVDVAYRDRVQDLFEQVGYNGYFTLGENDFTLPTHKFSDVIDCYENGINKWEQRVDRTLRQQGSCTAGIEVTLLKPYTDENYALSVPYSAKTASSFIPTATGDWFTEGTITL